MDHDKIEQVARIHKSELKDTDFLSKCSVRFLCLFYEKVLQYESTIFFTDEDLCNEIKGFIFCTTESHEYCSRFLRESSVQILLHPSVYLPLFGVIFKRITKMLSSNRNRYDYNSEVVYMAVKRQYHRQRVGKKLIKLAEDEFLKRNINKYYLQVFTDNAQGIAFYKSTGFDVIADIESGNRNKYLMCKSTQ